MFFFSHSGFLNREGRRRKEGRETKREGGGRGGEGEGERERVERNKEEG
jgi:hypothetical protein